MIRKTISMPDDMGNWIAQRMKSGQYNNESEYFRDLVRRDKEQREREQALVEALRAAEASGISAKNIPEIMREVKERLASEAPL